MLNKSVAVLVLSLTATHVVASDFGLGTDISGGRSLYFPIAFQAGDIVVEPRLYFANTGLQGSKYKYQGINISVDKFITEKKGFNTYMGVGFGHSLEKTEFTDDASYQSKISSKYIAPHLQIKYDFTESFSIGGEAGVRFEKNKHTSTDSFNYVEPAMRSSNTHSQYSYTEVVARYYFK
jgi:hypothetical protein